MHIFAHVQDCIPPGFTNGLHSNVVCGESCAHIRMRTVMHFVWLDNNKIQGGPKVDIQYIVYK
jgi:hypothetical protein